MLVIGIEPIFLDSKANVLTIIRHKRFLFMIIRQYKLIKEYQIRMIVNIQQVTLIK